MAFTLVINPNGTVTYAQNVPFNHVTDGSSANALNDTDTPITLTGLINATVTLTDYDGDTASASAAIGDRIRVLDDGPSISPAASAVEPQLAVDETVLSANASASFAGLFAGAYGADGAGTTSYKVATVDGTASGLVDVANGQSILLYNTASGVEGRVGGVDGAVAFSVTVAAGGIVTLDQVRALAHVPDAGPDQDSNGITEGSIKLIATITDKDGDSASAAVDISGNLNMKDDGPSISPTTAVEPSLEVDETNVGINASASFAGLFAGAYGADGAGTTSYKVATVDGTASGLVDVASGQPILLYNTASGVEGRVGGVEGAVAFSVTVNVDTGVVTLDQVRALAHTPDAGPDQNSNGITDAAIKLVATITDKDGDSASVAVNIGSNLNMKDDAPDAGADGRIREVQLSVDETLHVSNDSATLNVSGMFDAPVYGADGAGNTRYELNLASQGVASGMYALDASDIETAIDDIGQGAAIRLYQLADGSVVGSTANVIGDVSVGNTYFTISVNPDTGIVTFTQLQNIYHPDETNRDDSQSLNLEPGTLAVSQVVTDADGDSDSALFDLSNNVFVIRDDGPDAGADGSVGEARLVVDETPPAGDDSDTLDVSTMFDAPNYGTDGDGSTRYELNLAIQGAVTGINALDASDTETVIDDLGQGASILLYEIDGVVYGSTATDIGDVVAGNTYFTISVDADTGTVTFSQTQNIYHPDEANHDDIQSLDLEPGTLAVSQVVSDADGDSDSASVDLSNNVFAIRDDGPDSTLVEGYEKPILIVDESAPSPDGDGDNSDMRSFAAAFDLVIDHGSDGPGGVGYSLVLSSEGAGSGLYALDSLDTNPAGGLGKGAEIALVSNADGSISGVVGATVYFTISVNSSGDVTLARNPAVNMWHDDTANHDDPEFLSAAANTILLRQTVTDADGDADSENVDLSQNVFRFEDDGPDARNEVLQSVAEGSVATGAFDFDPGTDGAHVTHINGTKLTFGGEGWSQWIAVDDGQIRAKADGSYEFAANGAGSGETSGLFTVTDSDGDTNTATWAFNITDANIPIANPSPATLDDDGLVVPADPEFEPGIGDINANASEAAPTNGSEAVFHGALNASFGDDGPGGISFAAMHGTFGIVGTERVVYTWNAVTRTLLAEVAATDGGGNDQSRVGTDLFTLVMEAAPSVNYTLTLLDNVLHADDNGNDERSAPNVALSFTISDSDTTPGNEVPGTLNVNFNDDIPQLSNVASGSGVAVDETSAAAPGGFPISATSAAAMITGTAAFGADGPAGGASGGYTYGVEVNGAGNTLATSLVTAAGGFVITLVEIDADTIQGQYLNGGTQVAFTIQMNGDGTVTLTQNIALEHNTDGGPAGHPSHNDALNLSGLINATIKITDGDGDEVSSSAAIGDRITFNDDGPDVGLALQQGASIRIDETDGVVAAGGEVDPVGGNLGTVTVLGSSLFTVSDPHVSADTPTSYSYAWLLGTATADLVDSGLDLSSTNASIYLYVSGNTVTGSTALTSGGINAGNTVFTAVINPANGDITLTQFFAVEHGNTALHDEDSAALIANALQVQLTATDSDGDFDRSTVDLGSVIRFEDDGPSAADDGNKATVDDNAAGVNIGTAASLLVNDSFGADGQGSPVIAIVGNGTLGGTVTINSSGQLIYTSIHNVAPGATEVETFTYQIKDGDGDTATATFTVTLTDGGPSINPATASIAVDEEGLSGGIAGTLYGDGSDLAGVVTSQSGTLAGLSFGVDGPGNIALTAVADTGLRTLANQVVKSAWDNATHTLTGFVDTNGNGSVDVGETKVFTLQITNVNAGTYAFELLQPVKHAAANTEDNATFNIGVVVTDAEGDAANGTVTVLIDDDSPISFNPQDAVLANAAGSRVAFALDPIINGGDNNILNNFGADGPGFVRISASLDNTDSGMTSGGVKIWYILDSTGETLFGKTGTSAANAEASGATIFTVQINQAASQYTVDMNGTVDAFTNFSYDSSNSNFIGGNKAWFGIAQKSAGGLPPSDDDSHDLLITPLGTGDSVNTSGILGGIADGQSVKGGEGFRIDYVIDVGGTPPGNYVQGVANGQQLNSPDTPGEPNHWNTNGAFVTMRQSGGSNINIKAFDDNDNDNVVGDGSTNAITKIVISYATGNSAAQTFSSGELQLSASDNSWHSVTLNGVAFHYRLNPDDISVDILKVQGASGANDYPATTIAVSTATGFSSLEMMNIGSVTALIGGTNQTFASDTFKFAGFGVVTQSTDPVDFQLPIEIVDADGDIIAAAGAIDVTLNPVGPPVILDMNGDGVQFLGLNAGVSYDYGQGMVNTAWVDPQDGILVRDANGNGLVDNASEFVFGGIGVTDLEALHIQYGEQLDASDADFTMFALWIDANSNGTVDGSELQSLAEAGIVGLSLVSDGVAYSAAVGDVTVAGSTTYTRADGSTGQAADAQLSYGAMAKTTGAVEKIAVNTNTTVMAAAVAAAGFAAMPSAAAGNGYEHSIGDLNSFAIASIEPVSSMWGLEATSSVFAMAASLAGGFEMIAMPINDLPNFDATTPFQAGDLGLQSGLEFASVALLSGTDAMAGRMELPSIANEIFMPTADALAAMAFDGVQQNQTVEQIVADALNGGNAPSIDALLNALPGYEFGASIGGQLLVGDFDASALGGSMDFGTAFVFGSADNIMNEVLVLHHDAIQPAVNG